MSDVDIRVEMGDVERGMRAMKANAHDLQRVFRALGPEARDDQAKHQASTMGPDGPWPARAPSTVERLTARPRGRTKRGRARSRRRATRVLGRLPRALQVTGTASALIVKSTVEWSGVHHEGGSVGQGSRIPAREFLWFSDPFVKRAVDLIERYVVEPWSRGR